MFIITNLSNNDEIYYNLMSFLNTMKLNIALWVVKNKEHNMITINICHIALKQQ